MIKMNTKLNLQYHFQKVTFLHRVPQPNTHKSFTKLYPSMHWVQLFPLPCKHPEGAVSNPQFNNCTASEEKSL